MLDTLNDAVDVAEMLPHKAPNAAVLGNSLIAAAWELIACRRTFDGHVVDEGNGNMGNFVLEKIRSVAVLNLHGISVAHGIEVSRNVPRGVWKVVRSREMVASLR